MTTLTQIQLDLLNIYVSTCPTSLISYLAHEELNEFRIFDDQYFAMIEAYVVENE